MLLKEVALEGGMLEVWGCCRNLGLPVELVGKLWGYRGYRLGWRGGAGYCLAHGCCRRRHILQGSALLLGSLAADVSVSKCSLCSGTLAARLSDGR